MSTQALAQLFASGGPLASALPHYVPRPQQIELAQAVQQAIDAHGVLVAEAGTGTGKTWAYLLPLLMSSGKSLVSTGTRTLQDQLYHRDLPQLCAALELSASVALLKGRSNYLCHYYFDQVAQAEDALDSVEEVEQFKQIKQFFQHTDTGDKGELATVPENAPIWYKVTSTRENCRGQECPFINDCFVYKARRRAQDADIVVINHALFMADWVLREEGVCDLLPDTQAIVFDEAHHLPATATRFLGVSVSSYQLRDFADQLQLVATAQAAGVYDWQRLAANIRQAIKQMQLDCTPLKDEKGQKSTFESLPMAAQLDLALEQLLGLLGDTIEALGQIEEHHPDLKALHLSAIDLYSRLYLWTQPDRSGQTQTTEFLDSAFASQLEQQAVRWVEYSSATLRFHRAPLEVNHIFGQAKEPNQAWVFTSATLSVRGDFSHFLAQLGLVGAQTCHWPSPFDYQHQAALFVPQHMPLPHSREFNGSFVDQLWPLIEQTEGGVLVLCTTLRAVSDIAQQLLEKNSAANAQRTILQQGEHSRSRLLKDFAAQPRTVLVGSASFWEGVDFPGDTLTVVAIDRLPFAPPDDPVISARIEQCRREGGNPFRSLQLPAAAIALKQGAGRLIRSEQDHGVLMIADTRIVEKNYGRYLWQGLPPFSRTRKLDEALRFVRPPKPNQAADHSAARAPHDDGNARDTEQPTTS